MRILLTNLPRESETRDYTTREYLLTDFSRYPPLGLLAIAADVEPRHSIKVLDVIVANMSIQDTIQYIQDYKPDVLGISVVTRRLYAMRVVTQAVKQALPNTAIVVGGPHINYWPTETLQLGALDYVLPGYGERTFPLLIDAIEAGEKPDMLRDIPNLHYRANDQICSNPSDEESIVLDSLPFPNRQLLDLKAYYSAVDKDSMTTTYSSRGCPFRCIFCDVQEKHYRYRSAQRLVDEFEEIIKLGFKEIHVFDDTFNIRRQRVIDICNEILRRGLKVRWSARSRVSPFDEEMMSLLKRAGCSRLHVGVESLDPAMLRLMNKKQTLEQIQSFFRLCKEYDMETLAYFIIGFPGETREYRRSLYKEVSKLGATYAFVNVLYPLPKTKYYESLIADATFREDHWAHFVQNPTADFYLPFPRSPELQRELVATADDFHRRFCYSPRFILSEFRKARLNPKMLLFRIKLALVLLRETWLQRRQVVGIN